MRDQLKNKKAPGGKAVVVRGGKGAAGDSASRQLRGASSKLGNAALEQRVLKTAEAKAPGAKTSEAKAPEAKVAPKAAEVKVAEKAPVVVEKAPEAKVAPKAAEVKAAEKAPAVVEKAPEAKVAPKAAEVKAAEKAPAVVEKAPEAKVAPKAAEVKAVEVKPVEKAVAKPVEVKTAEKAPAKVAEKPVEKVAERAASKPVEVKTAEKAPAKVAEKAPSTVVDKAPEAAKKAEVAKAAVAKPAEAKVVEKAPVVVKAAEEEKAAPKKGTEAKKDAQATALDPKANTQQKALLDHICGRVKAIYTVQQVERAEMKNENQWFRDVARKKEGFHLPDPTRFHEATQLYQRAAKALCAGDVSQGAKLLEKANTAEKEALDNLPKMVENKLTTAERAAPEMPDSLGAAMTDLSPAERIAMPKEMELARKILSIEDKMEPTAPLKHNKKRWFSELEEDEDENNPNKKGGEAKGA